MLNTFALGLLKIIHWLIRVGGA